MDTELKIMCHDIYFIVFGMKMEEMCVRGSAWVRTFMHIYSEIEEWKCSKAH